MTSIRESLTSIQRATELYLTIDPGFVHHRKIQTIIGRRGMSVIDSAIGKLPEMPDWQKKVRIDHIYTDVMLIFCKTIGIRPLQHNFATKEGQIFCSNERLGPCEQVYEEERVVSKWIPPDGISANVEFHYSTRHIYSDTLKSRLHHGGCEFAIIAQLYDSSNSRYIFEPIIIGFPWLRKLEEEPEPTFDIMWYGQEFFENFIEDFDEFNSVLNVPQPKNCEPMQKISEKAFKMCLAEILGDNPSNDWGGETSDHYTSHIHLNGRRKTAAFLLKGPARFAPMNLNHLGKNNDQIVRLAKEPAQVLFVQHCHDVGQAVRETLRAFSVQPGNPRRFCIIDGKDSLRLLKAYNLFDKALELSNKKVKKA